MKQSNFTEQTQQLRDLCIKRSRLANITIMNICIITLRKKKIPGSECHAKKYPCNVHVTAFEFSLSLL